MRFASCHPPASSESPRTHADSGNGNSGSQARFSRHRIRDGAIPSGVAAVGNFALVGYDLVSCAEICGDVTEVGRSAFEDCASLTEIDLGGAVKTLGNRAFNGAPLTSITSRNSVPPTFATSSTIATFGAYDAVVYVPVGSSMRIVLTNHGVILPI